MNAAQPSFSTSELGKIASMLQRVCRGCPRGTLACRAQDCSVSAARDVIGRYLCTRTQLEAGVGSALVQVPAEAVIDKPLLEQAAEGARALCNRCMFHVEPCFINRLCALIDQGLDRPARPLSVRPADPC